MRLRFLVSLSCFLLGAGCGGRSTPVVQDSGLNPDVKVDPDSQVTSPDGAPDSGFKDDATPGDLPLKPDLPIKPPTLCNGPARAEAAMVTLKVDHLATHMNYVASCCPPGEVINFKTYNPKGQSVEISVQVARFPNTPLPPTATIDLAKPPAGWYFGVYCTPSSFCGNAHPSSHAFKGYLKYQSLLGSPAVQVTVCLEATPLDPTNPLQKPIRLWASNVMVNKVCVPQMNQTCNYDPIISSLRGVCNPDSTCTCNPGSTKMANGKCK